MAMFSHYQRVAFLNSQVVLRFSRFMSVVPGESTEMGQRPAMARNLPVSRQIGNVGNFWKVTYRRNHGPMASKDHHGNVPKRTDLVSLISSIFPGKDAE